MSKILTIGSASYNDTEGAWFTYQSLRLNCEKFKDSIDYIIVDNSLGGDESLKRFCENTDIKYHHDNRRSTAVRNQVFKQSTTPWTMCIDSHVLFAPDTIGRFIEWILDNQDCTDLIHGPMQYDWFTEVVTHMSPVWRDKMFGIWDNDTRGDDVDADPFSIPMHGMGLFASRTDDWLGFHKMFKG